MKYPKVKSSSIIAQLDQELKLPITSIRKGIKDSAYILKSYNQLREWV